MDPKEKSPSDESVLEAPYVGDTRSYSDFILYLVNSGRFQHNNLLDHGRRKGVLTLFQAERVVKLTRERRLSPVKVAFTPGGRKQLVYLIAIVRTGKLKSWCPNPLLTIIRHNFSFLLGCTLEDLNDLVDRLNMYIDEMSPDDKESAVRDLIYSTTSRVMPGIRYLPIHWYEAGEVVPPREIIDEDNRRVDGDGMPIVDTDEELVVVQQGKGNDRRNSKDVAMPSTSAVLSDASTDSDRAIPTHKKNKRKAPLPPVNWRTAEVSTIYPLSIPLLANNVCNYFAYRGPRQAVTRQTWQLRGSRRNPRQNSPWKLRMFLKSHQLPLQTPSLITKKPLSINLMRAKLSSLPP